MPEDKDFLSQFSNEGKPESFREEERVPVTRERKPVNVKLLIVLVLLAIILALLGFFLFMAPKIVMPDFIGKTKSDVAAWTKQQGIEPAGIIFEETYDFSAEEGTIMTQSIPSGKKVKKDVKLNFTLSLGPDPDERIRVPDLETMEKEDIQNWITNNKLAKTKIMTAYNDNVPEGRVIDYSFSGCEEDSFTRGCTLKINVSKGKTPAGKVTMEDFEGKMYESIEAWAKTKNIRLDKVEQYSDKYESGKVISTSVAAGKTIDEGSTVTVVVSKGKAVVMPNMYEWKENEITAWCSKNHVSLLPFVYRYDEEAAGECIAQSIAPGKLVEEGDYLEVTISLDDPDMREFFRLYGEHAAYQDLYNWIKEKDAQGAHLYINVSYQLHDTIPIDHIISVSREIHNHDTVQVVVSDGKNIMLKNYTEYDEGGNLIKEVKWDQMDYGQADEEDARRICDANGVACVITYEKKEGLYNGDVITVTRSDDGTTPLAGTYLPQRQSIRIVIADNGADGQRP